MSIRPIQVEVTNVFRSERSGNGLLSAARSSYWASGLHSAQPAVPWRYIILWQCLMIENITAALVSPVCRHFVYTCSSQRAKCRLGLQTQTHPHTHTRTLTFSLSVSISVSLSLSLCVSLCDTHARARTHAHTHTHTHVRSHVPILS